MPQYPRYAIYFVPSAESSLYRFGAELLGYDAYSGEPLPFAEGIEADVDDWRKLTADPRKYGFHATLKAPISLADDAEEIQLSDNVMDFANTSRALPVITPVVRLLGNFIAIVPDIPSSNLSALAADCVKAFDRFRAPLTDQDRRRRNIHALTDTQIAHLDRWGYPYVFEDFRFHMTLTGSLPSDRNQSILEILQRRFAALKFTAITIDRIGLLRQRNAASQFVVVSSHALNESKAQ